MKLYRVKYESDFSHVERYITCNGLADIPIYDKETGFGISKIEVIKEQLIVGNK
jgi:hypothetical protein